MFDVELTLWVWHTAEIFGGAHAPSAPLILTPTLYDVHVQVLLFSFKGSLNTAA